MSLSSLFANFLSIFPASHFRLLVRTELMEVTVLLQWCCVQRTDPVEPQKFHFNFRETGAEHPLLFPSNCFELQRPISREKFKRNLFSSCLPFVGLGWRGKIPINQDRKLFCSSCLKYLSPHLQVHSRICQSLFFKIL